jgi:membrane protein required for beta-lactamase induction
VRAFLAWLGVSVLVVVVLLFALPGERELVLDIWFLAVGALALLATLHATVGRLPAEQPSPIDEPPAARADELPKDLADLENLVAMGAESEFDLYFRLRPRLRRIAEAKLREHGIDFDATPDEAAELLGPAAWDLLRPDRPRPDPTAKARSLPAITAVADALERL